MNSVALINKLPRSLFGYHIGLFGLVLIYLWLGVYKFTPTEAAAIEPLVSNSFFMSWLYTLFSVQVVSGIVGTIEILVGLGLVWGLVDPRVGFYFGIASTVILTVTLSFLLTTPGVWKLSDGIVVANFFLVKDILLLAVSVMVVEKNWYTLKQSKS